MEFNNNKKILQNIFRYYFTHKKNIKLPLKDIKAAEAIMRCRTQEQGFNYLACPDGHEERIQTHSCRHRSCPICADKARHEWIEAEKTRLLNCPHYHVIFTLPHEYLNLWQYNRAWFTKTFFKTCRDTLIELMEDKKYLGATPGILMTLHTWGRQLNYHPHVHCLVTAGGIMKDKTWCSTKDDYLLPIRVVKSLFRGKLQAKIKIALKANELTIPGGSSLNSLLWLHRQLYKKNWSIRIQEKYEHGKGVMLYLARYMKGGPIKPEQIISCGKKTRFQYKDHRDQRIKTLSLNTNEFIKRILWHVPETNIHVVRHYGLYAPKSRKKHAICQQLVGKLVAKGSEAGQLLKDTVNWCCETCGKRLNNVFSTYQSGRYENSIKKSGYWIFVQQVVQDDFANPVSIRGPCEI